MLKNILLRAVPLAFAVALGSSSLAFADNSTAVNVPAAATVWTDAGFHVVAPTDMWPMLETLHQFHMDWELYAAGTRPTPLVWADLPPGVYGQYVPSLNVVRVSYVLQNESTNLAASFLAHELTHLNDDLGGKLGNMSGDVCYAAETRAFVNEANFWQMVNGAQGKPSPDALELQENTKMFAFVGNAGFADLVLRTTASYIKQCGS